MKDLKDIIDWLVCVEGTAARIYDKAARRFSHDRDFAEFLTLLREDEITHHDIMERASKLAGEEELESLPSVIFLKNETKRDLDTYLRLLEQRIETRELDREKLIDHIISIEYGAENNDLFLYIVNTFKHRNSEFTLLAAKIQQHRQNIERFVDAHPELGRFSDRIKSYPKVWEERLLVAESNHELTDAVTSVLANECKAETVTNGTDALDRISRNYYAAVVADVDLPDMDGTEIIRRCAEKFPTLRDRVLFFADKDDRERRAFLEKNHLRYLSKPTGLADIKKEVVSILAR